MTLRIVGDRKIPMKKNLMMEKKKSSMRMTETMRLKAQLSKSKKV